MIGQTLWHKLIFNGSAAVGGVFCLLLLLVLIRKPSSLFFFFFVFYLISVFHLAGNIITFFLLKNSGALSLREFWQIGSTLGRIKYLFLILFVHSVYRFRVTPGLLFVMIPLTLLAVAAPFFIYSIIPNLVEIIVIFYSFFYWLAVYLLREKLALSSSRRRLLQAVLFCSALFLAGVILDLLERIPQASPYFSILLIDFYPFYLVSLGTVMTVWAVRDLKSLSCPSDIDKTIYLDISGISLTRREREIVDLILKGDTNSTIADRLFISESTVKKHINNIFRKLQITNRWELLKYQEKKGIDKDKS